MQEKEYKQAETAWRMLLQTTSEVASTIVVRAELPSEAMTAYKKPSQPDTTGEVTRLMREFIGL